MKRIHDILLIVLVIGSLILISTLIFVGTAMGTRDDNSGLSTKEEVASENLMSNNKALNSDGIPQGKMKYELYFSEFDGRMENLAIEILITGNTITVYNSEENPLTGGKIIIEGILLRHKSGKWIIGEAESDMKEDEIGGCSGGPTPIDFKTKIIEWC